MSIMPSPRRNIRTLVFLMPDSVKYMEQVLELARCTNASASCRSLVTFQSMEKHQVMLPTSSTSSTPFSSDFKVDYISTVHVENEVLRTQRMAISEQKESDKEFIKQHRYVFQTKSQVDVLDDGIPVEKIYEKDSEKQ
ncbi:hypothetical protein JHK86_010794 [Glycine max]|nr:hypothetical protein JHK86_010794 [Glycine max]